MLIRETQLQILTAVVKLFLKKPADGQAQGLVQKIFQIATAENDNPDVRDRAYVYWRLLSSNAQVAQNIVLSDKPPITTTIQSLPPALLDQLINELSTLASVYHKPPKTFIGHGKYGADAVQKAAIEYAILLLHRVLTSFREAMQNALENPLAAAAAVSGNASSTATTNNENLLDFDFDGGALASAVKAPVMGMSGLEGLAGTSQRVPSPAAPNGGQSSQNALEDLMGLDSMRDAPLPMDHDMMDGFASLDLTASNPAPQQQRNNDDLLGLF